jgi:hypothetical protein
MLDRTKTVFRAKNSARVGVQDSIGPLSNLPDEKILSGKEACFFAGVSDETMRIWRRKGLGPPYVTLPGGRPGYVVGAYRRWLRELASA